jgi:transposase
MLQLTPQMRILVAVAPVDFRKGIDGLGGLCRARFRQEPLSGCVFVFRNRRATALKILMYDGQGFWLCQKRLSKGRFGWWPACAEASAGRPESAVEALRELEARELQLMVWNGDPGRAGMAPLWRRVSNGSETPPKKS